MALYARGDNAFGFCDRCQWRQPLNDLKPEYVARKPTGFLVCEECLDEDHPQLMLGRLRFTDPQALRNPRPPKEIDAMPVAGSDGLLDISFKLDGSALK